MVNDSSAAPQVSRAIRKIVWQELREHGFIEKTSRSAWRYRDDTIDVVNFQAAVGSGGFPLFLRNRSGGEIEASLGSFSVNVGTFYSVRRILPWTALAYSPPSNSERPPEWSCDQRRRLRTSISQKEGYPQEIWEVSASVPESPTSAVEDARSAILFQALPWFERNTDLEHALTELGPACWLRARDMAREPDKLFDAEDLFAALAIRLGRVDEAVRLFEAIVDRSFLSADRAAYDKEEARRQRRLARSKRPVSTANVPFWHDGAVARIAALQGLLSGSAAR